MNIVYSIEELRMLLDASTAPIEFVPTMGNIHQGHLDLVRAAKARGGYVVVSIFVNPTQFGVNEDFASYPRTQDKDSAPLQQASVDCLFMPEQEVIYPRGFVPVVINMPSLTDVFCGKTRPQFFSGVCQVMLILCNIVKPNRLYLGQKDWQQWLVLHTLFVQLYLHIDIIRVPIARDADGVALSSRNSYLNTTERALAPLLQQTLQHTASLITQGNDIETMLAEAKKRLSQAGFIIDYFALVCPTTLATIDTQEQRGTESLLISAAYLGKTRLLDNLLIR